MKNFQELYDLLDWLEKERPELIHDFWKAVFKEVTMKHYPTLRRLHDSLMEGQFYHSSRNEHKTENIQAPSLQSQKVTSLSYNPHKETFQNKIKKEARDERTKKELSENETEEKTNTTPGKRKTRKVEESTSEEEEKEKQRKPLRVEAPVGRRRTRKIQMCEFSVTKPHFCSDCIQHEYMCSYACCLATPLKKGEEGDIWMWPFFEVQLPVKCGEQEGLLDRNRMAKGHINYSVWQVLICLSRGY